MPVFNIPAILAAVDAGIEAGLEVTAAYVVADARRRAPIRKVFKERAGYKRKFRPLTPVERAIATRRANAYYSTNTNPVARRAALRSINSRAQPGGRGAELRNRSSNNNLSKSGALRTLGVMDAGKFTPYILGVRKMRGGRYDPGQLGQFLTSRGKYEVSSGRAINLEPTASGTTRVRVGGRLKASIESEGVTPTQMGMEVRVTAGVHYAKFVEFPTVHNAAQPFLRPALQDARSRLVRDVATGVRRSLGG